MQPILQPLYKSLHKETEFKWMKEHQKLFDRMKRTITKQLEITMTNTSKPFYIWQTHPIMELEQTYSNNTLRKKKLNLISANSILLK